MSKCPKCDGSGLLPGKNLGEFRVCDLCKGSGQEYEQQTNEEWLNTLDTWDKGMALSKVVEELGSEASSPYFWADWLKAVHK